jgi:hypothetical protein
MAEQRTTLRQRWAHVQVGKTALFWSCAGAAVATMIVGFTVGGWVTGGTAAKMAGDAGSQAQAELAATICVERFAGGDQPLVQLAELQDIDSSYRQRTFVADGGWATMPGMDRPNSAAAGLCAERLLNAE